METVLQWKKDVMKKKITTGTKICRQTGKKIQWATMPKPGNMHPRMSKYKFSNLLPPTCNKVVMSKYKFRNKKT